jgi:hypothetical protein
MKPTVYIETTIPSFCHETRKDHESLARKAWTEEWWKYHRMRYECFSSLATLNELRRGSHPERQAKIDMVSDLPRLNINDSVEEIVEIYISNTLMPSDQLGDALHLALASYYKIDFLLTWNCVHLANANKQLHIRRINERLRLFTPELVTPLELIDQTS